MISTVIPVYNTKSEWLDLAVQSILSQTFKNFEIILVDDGSTNQSTLDSLKKYDEYPNVRIIYLEKNIGISGAINKGIKESKYNLIARMDSDDIAHSSRFQTQFNYLYMNPRVDLVGTDVDFIEEHNGEYKRTNKLTKHPRIITREIAKESFWFINHPTVMFRKQSILDVGGYDESLKGLAEDYELWVRMINNGKVMHNINNTEFLLRGHSDSYTANNRNIDHLQKVQDTLRTLNKTKIK